MSLAVELKTARQTSGLSLRELARRIGVSAGHLSRIENGLLVPGESCLAGICKQTGADFDRIMGELHRVPEDVIQYIAQNPQVLARLRREMRRGAAA